jgi:hypothetical protein
VSGNEWLKLQTPRNPRYHSKDLPYTVSVDEPMSKSEEDNYLGYR